MTYVVYRAFDREGRLLYIGSTNNVRVRMVQHKKGARWYGSMALFTVEEHDTEPAARQAERDAIEREMPPFNISHTSRVYGPRAAIPSAPSATFDEGGMLTLQEAARRLEMDSTTLSRQAQRGVLHAVRFGREWAVTADEVERYRNEHKGKRGQASPRYQRKPKGVA